MRAAGLIRVASLCLWPFAGCATRIELTAAEGAALATAMTSEATEGPRRSVLVLDARPARGPGGDLHVIADGDRVCLVLLDPLGVVLKSILTPDLLWLRARDPGGRQIEARCPGSGDQRVCRVLAALRALRPFAPRPFHLARATRVWIDGPSLVAEAPADADRLVERRTYDRVTLRCIEREILLEGQPLAVVRQDATPESLELELPDLSFRLRLKVLDRDDQPDIAPGAFTPG